MSNDSYLSNNIYSSFDNIYLYIKKKQLELHSHMCAIITSTLTCNELPSAQFQYIYKTPYLIEILISSLNHLSVLSQLIQTTETEQTNDLKILNFKLFFSSFFNTLFLFSNKIIFVYLFHSPVPPFKWFAIHSKARIPLECAKKT